MTTGFATKSYSFSCCGFSVAEGTFAHRVILDTAGSAVSIFIPIFLFV